MHRLVLTAGLKEKYLQGVSAKIQMKIQAFTNKIFVSQYT